MTEQITCFEDLSNELLYEIFDYFDYDYIYETFGNLNDRFNQLILHSSLPIKLNFSLLSKSTFQHRCTTVLLPNVHRIISLHFSHHLLIEHFFTSFSLDAAYMRLEILTFENIKAENLITILSVLIFLPQLSSLTLTSIEKIRSRNPIYSCLFLLPALKYCKLSIDVLDQHSYFSLENTESSSIEHLVLDTKCNLNELIEFLPHTPQLHRLSCRLSTTNSSLSGMNVVPRDLNSIHLQLEDTSFDEFEWFISHFSPQLQVLRVFIRRDVEFLNADRWQRLITEQMPRLDRFCLQYQTIVDESNDRYHQLMDRFNSTFWCHKQWVFTHQHYRSKDLNSWIRFYSTQPYRWNRYELHEDACQDHETGVNLAREVNLHSYRMTKLRFPRAIRLILSEGDPSSISNLIDLFPPRQLIELVISDEQLRLEQLLFLLHHFPTIRYLTIPTSILNLSSAIRLKFPVNHLNRVTIVNRCTLEDIQILHRFCPYLQNLDIEVEKESLELITRFLLLKNSNRTFRDRLSARSSTNNLIFWQQEYSDCLRCTKTQQLNSSRSPCNHHLSSLCFRDVNYRMIEKLRFMIDQEILLNDYSIEYIDQKLFLWW